MRGLLIYPARVPVLLLFEDSNPVLFENAKKAWGALSPQIVDDADTKVLDYHYVIAVTRRSSDELLETYSGVPDMGRVSSSNPAEAAEQLTVQVTLQVLKHYSGDAHLLHAAVLGDPQTRRAFALVAASGTGKTTASKVLGRKLAYLSDETAVIRYDRSLVPYLKPLSIIENKDEPKRQYSPLDLGLEAVDPADDSYQLEHIIILNRVETPQAPELSRIPLDKALFRLVAQSSGVQRSSTGLGDLTQLINEVGGILMLTYSEVSETVNLLEDVLGERYCVPREYVEFEHQRSQRRGSIRWTPGQRELVRSAETEGLTFENRYYLTTGGRLSEVSVVAWDLWCTAEAPMSPDSLFEQMSQMYGSIERSDFDTAVRSMVEIDMLTYSGDIDELSRRPDTRQ